MPEPFWTKAALMVHDSAHTVGSIIGERFQLIPIFIVLQASMFFSAYIAAHAVTESSKRRGALASCCVSMVHNSVAVLGSTVQLLQLWPYKFDDVNTQETNILLQYSVAYMMTDFLCYLLPFTPNDLVFITHHFVAGGYMLDCVHLQRAGATAMPWLWLGEVTGPLLNVFSIARHLREEHKAAAAALRILSPVFTIVFVVVRTGGFLPLYAWWSYKLLYHCNGVPLWHRVCWITWLGVGVAGSQVWSWKLVKGFTKHWNAAKKEQ